MIYSKYIHNITHSVYSCERSCWCNGMVVYLYRRLKQRDILSRDVHGLNIFVDYSSIQAAALFLKWPISYWTNEKENQSDCVFEYSVSVKISNKLFTFRHMNFGNATTALCCWNWGFEHFCRKRWCDAMHYNIRSVFFKLPQHVFILFSLHIFSIVSSSATTLTTFMLTVGWLLLRSLCASLVNTRNVSAIIYIYISVWYV